jgi:F0F1-type ATP synthase assembly protein I
MPENQKKKKNQLNSYIKYSSLTLQMAVIILAGTFFGDFLDSKNNFNLPIFTIIFSLLSIAFSLYFVFNKITNDH